MPFHQGRSGRATAERFQPQRTRTGEQIDGVFSAHADGYQIKHGLANPFFHRPGARIGGINQFPSAHVAANNSRRCFGRLRRIRWVLFRGHDIMLSYGLVIAHDETRN
jgi:hypothetical protein